MCWWCHVSAGSFCKRRLDGRLYQDPADCRAYIYCSGGYAYRAQCDEGLYYDHKLQACNYDNGQCAGEATHKSHPHFSAGNLIWRLLGKLTQRSRQACERRSGGVLKTSGY